MFGAWIRTGCILFFEEVLKALIVFKKIGQCFFTSDVLLPGNKATIFLLLLMLYFLLFSRIFIFYKKTSQISEFSSNIILSIVLLMFIQTMIHILVNIGLFPTKGMGLPFISYGGTNLLLMFTYIGILIRIQIENKQTFSQAVLKNQKWKKTYL